MYMNDFGAGDALTWALDDSTEPRARNADRQRPVRKQPVRRAGSPRHDGADATADWSQR